MFSADVVWAVLRAMVVLGPHEAGLSYDGRRWQIVTSRGTWTGATVGEALAHWGAA